LAPSTSAFRSSTASSGRKDAKVRWRIRHGALAFHQRRRQASPRFPARQFASERGDLQLQPTRQRSSSQAVTRDYKTKLDTPSLRVKTVLGSASVFSPPVVLKAARTRHPAPVRRSRMAGGQPNTAGVTSILVHGQDFPLMPFAPTRRGKSPQERPAASNEETRSGPCIWPVVLPVHPSFGLYFKLPTTFPERVFQEQQARPRTPFRNWIMNAVTRFYWEPLIAEKGRVPAHPRSSIRAPGDRAGGNPRTSKLSRNPTSMSPPILTTTKQFTPARFNLPTP